jgi:hypothetical protein
VLWRLRSRVAGAEVGGDRGKLGDVLTSAEKGGRVAGGGPQRRPTVVVRGGGAPVAGSRRETMQQV